jgi:hypothetical protein
MDRNDRDEFSLALDPVLCDLQRLERRAIKEVVAAGKTNDLVHYLCHGFNRRLAIIGRSMENVFEHFSPRGGDLVDTTEAMINLHAFLINVAGAFDCLAWAYLSRHGIVIKKQSVGLFIDATRKHLPKALVDHLLKVAESWQHEYAKDFRDALAHRVPPYIADTITMDQELAIQAKWPDPAQEHERQAERVSLLQPSPYFLHSALPDRKGERMHLHGQVLSDSKLVIDVGNTFFDHWAEQRTSS